MPNTIPSVFDPKPMNTSPNFSEGADLLLSNFMSQSNATLLKNAETLTSCVHMLLHLPMKNIPYPAEEDKQHQI